MVDGINAAAQIWCRYMTSAALQATLLALALLGVTWIVRRRSPALCHALLMIALLKFAIPPTLSLPTGLFSQIKPQSAPMLTPQVRSIAPIIQDALWLTEEVPPAGASALAGQAGVAGKPVPPRSPASSLPPKGKHTLNVKAWLMMTHMLGILLILSMAVWQRIRLVRLSAGATPAADLELLAIRDGLCESMRLARKPRLLLSGGNHAPMTFGAWKPVIVLTQDLVAALPLAELRVILGHELAHHRRRDLWLSWLQVPISALWWFNPVYWLLVRRIRGVREDCCDDLVVASGLASGKAYCETLLQAARVASGNALAGASLAYIGESQPLRRRFRRIMSGKLIAIPKLAWAGILIVVLLGLLFLPGVRRRSAPPAPEPAATKPRSEMPAARAALPEPLPPVLPAAGPSSREVVFRAADAATGLAIQGAAFHQRAIGAELVTPLSSDLIVDKEGRCAVLVNAPAAVSVRANGYVSRSFLFRAGEEFPAEYAFRLGKAAVLGGYVRDEQGKPIRDVQITASGYPFSLAVKETGREVFNQSLILKTDGEGRWICNEFHPDLDSVNLILVHPEYVRTQYSTQALGVQDFRLVDFGELKAARAVLVMKYGLLVAGTVRDDKGKSIEGASVVHIEQRRRVSTTATGPDGRFSFADAKPGEFVLKVVAAGYAPEIRTIQVTPRVSEIEFRLGKGQIVRGRIVDDDRVPVPDVDIRAIFLGIDDEFAPPWQTKSDAEGRFLWDSAPSTPWEYRVMAMGFKPLDAPLILEPGKEHEIKIQRLQVMRISGKVVDAATRMPIEKFTATAMPFGSVGGRQVEGSNGEFSIPVYEGVAKYQIAVEAAGYRPDNSQVVEFRKGDWKFELALVRGDGPSGVVKLPGGEPVPEANVFLCGGYFVNSDPKFSQEKVPAAPVIMGIKSVRPTVSRAFANTITDQAGGFALTPIADPLTVIVTHEKGFASVTVEQLTGLPTITLQPWGRVEGVLRIGVKPAAGEIVILRSMLYGTTAQPPGFLANFRAQTDAEGKFAFPTIPPGEYRVAHMESGPAAGESQSATAVVRVGDTTTILLGGRGRPVIGRLAASGADSPVDWKNARGTITLKVPEVLRPESGDRAGFHAWSQTEEAKKWARAQHSHPVAIAADGSFRVEDVEPGTYVLNVTLRIPNPAQPVGPSRSFQITKEFVIGEMAGGRSDTPQDLGTLTIQITSASGKSGTSHTLTNFLKSGTPPPSHGIRRTGSSTPDLR